MHKYPRKIVRTVAPDFKDKDCAATLIFETPGSHCRRFSAGGVELDRGVFERDMDDVLTGKQYTSHGFSEWNEVLHEPETVQLEKKCAIVFLKSLVKELRTKLKAIEKLKHESLIGETEAHKLLLKCAFGTAADRRHVKRELQRKGATIGDLAKLDS